MAKEMKTNKKPYLLLYREHSGAEDMTFLDCYATLAEAKKNAQTIEEDSANGNNSSTVYMIAILLEEGQLSPELIWEKK